jgi:hypothetical protein
LESAPRTAPSLFNSLIATGRDRTSSNLGRR